MSEHETHEVIVSICGPVPDWCRCEIVRCRDCKHYDRMNDDEGMCMVPDDDGDYARWTVDDVGYCYLGERKEGESLEVWNQWSADDVTCSEES